MVKVDFIYHKMVSPRSAFRSTNPACFSTSFRNELRYGVYDDVVDEVIEAVEKNHWQSNPNTFNFASTDAE